MDNLLKSVILTLKYARILSEDFLHARTDFLLLTGK